jgi:signal transduction histidine kinase
MPYRTRAPRIVWFLTGAIPALLLGLVIGPTISHLALERPATTAELAALALSMLIALLGSLGGWLAASRFHHRLLGRDIAMLRSWLELLTKDGFPLSPVGSVPSPTLREIAPSIERAAAELQARAHASSERIREIEARAAARTKAHEELEQVNYIITHHLHEPLIRITTYLDMFGRQMRGKLAPPAARFLHSVHSGVKKIETLIEDLSLYSRSIYGSPDIYETDITAIVRSVLESLDIEVTESGAQISIGDLPTVWVNPNEITKVFRHLIANAIRYRRGDSPKIEVRAEQRGDRTVFSVTDDGIGIDPVAQRTLFSVFERVHTDPAYVGSGIGLAVCKKIIEHHGGEITVRSTLGEGSTFFFSIPARPHPARSHHDPEKRVH